MEAVHHVGVPDSELVNSEGAENLQEFEYLLFHQWIAWLEAKIPHKTTGSDVYRSTFTILAIYTRIIIKFSNFRFSNPRIFPY